MALCFERARAEAYEAERRYTSGGDAPALLGVPFAAKDLFDTAGVVTAYGSAMFAQHVPDKDAAAVAAVRRAGAILVGKTQTHEFAWGLHRSTQRWAARATLGPLTTSPAARAGARRWPWPPGSCRSLLARTRRDRSACRPRCVALWASSPPTAREPGRLPARLVTGPRRPDREDARRCGPGAAQISRHAPLAFRDQPARAIAGLRVGVPADGDDVAVRDAGDALARAGAKLVPMRVPSEAARALLPRVQGPEALLHHTRAGVYPGRSSEYGDDVRRRLEHASALDPKDYVAAQEELANGSGSRCASSSTRWTCSSVVARHRPRAWQICRPSATPSGKTRLS